ncbi:MAG: beta-lactamase family protein [Ruminococcaceae bacterium]|nr:beta-lactamase family protein [Oscillospiraceae bacterium]
MLDRSLLKETIESRLSEDIKLCKVGAAQILVKEKGEVAYEAMFGDFKSKEGKALGYDTVFRLASMTKPVTAVAVMIMVERGLIDLDKDIDFYIPEFKNMLVGEYKDDGSEILSTTAAKRLPKVRELLCHTSGIGSLGAAGYYNKSYASEYEYSTLEGAVLFHTKIPFAFEPGTKESYSPNAAFDVAALIVQRVSGVPYDEFLKKEIFIPCGMTDTSFAPEDEQWDRMIFMHDRIEDEKGVRSVVGKTEEGRVCVFVDFPVTHLAAGAGLASTISDYSKFAEMILNKGVTESGERILSEKSVEEMTSLQIHDEKVQGGNQRWALGGRVIMDETYGSLPAGTYGWSGAYGTHFWVDFKNQITAVYMKNSLYDGGAGATTANNFEKDVYSSIK